MLEQSLADIDVNNITKRMFAYIVVEHFNPIEEKQKKEYDIDVSAVDWFLKFKEEEINELLTKVFDINNFFVAFDTVYDKVLKK